MATGCWSWAGAAGAACVAGVGMSDAVVAVEGTLALDCDPLLATSDGDGAGAAGSGVTTACCCGCWLSWVESAVMRALEASDVDASDATATWLRTGLIEALFTGAIGAVTGVLVAAACVALMSGAALAVACGAGAGAGVIGAAAGRGAGRLVAVTTGLACEPPDVAYSATPATPIIRATATPPGSWAYC